MNSLYSILFDIQRIDKETEFTFSALEELKVSRDYSQQSKEKRTNKQKIKP